MTTIFELIEGASAHASTSVGCELTRGATGRTTRSIEQEEVEDDLLVAEWSRIESIEAMLTHNGAKRFLELMRLQPQLARGIMQAFRARPRLDITGEPKPSDFGPPPAERARSCRYNEERCPVLYLASTPGGVWAELNHDSQRQLSCQEFVVDLSSMRIFDGSWSGSHNFLHLAWDAAERHAIPEYAFSRALAKLVRDAGFEGMLVPGVRGARDSQYLNLVVFEPGLHWREWLAPERVPFTMDVAPVTGPMKTHILSR